MAGGTKRSRGAQPRVLDLAAPSVDFETKCWEKDWRLISDSSYIGRMIARCNYAFRKRRVIINNVADVSVVAKAMDRLVEARVIDEFSIAEELADATLSAYEIDPASFKGGYPYSIAELVGVRASSSDYILHFSSDSIMEGRIRPAQWVEQALDVMRVRDDVVVANPAWNWRFRKAAAASVEDLTNFYVSCGFSDQCYLIKRSVFDSPIYNYQHDASDIYPEYGGNSFEKRVFCFMRACDKKRITHKAESYWHRNINRMPTPSVRRLASVSELRWLRNF
jgi:hypothetical protein